jgi:vacuolar protein sorting-associated protein 72
MKRSRPEDVSEDDSLREIDEERSDDEPEDGEREDQEQINDDEDDEVDAESDSEKAPVEVKVLPARSTRGVRMSRLVGEAAEADAAFWEQEAFAEEDDEDFSEIESEESDETDSDIDLPEPEDDQTNVKGSITFRKQALEDDDEAVWGDGKSKKSGKYIDRGLDLVKGMDMSAILAAGRAMRAKAQSSEGDSSSHLPPVDQKISTPRIVAIPSENNEPKLSQAQVLVDAASTTIENIRSLEAMVKMETERQAKDLLDQQLRKQGQMLPPSLPIVRFHSKRGTADTITFTNVDSFPNFVGFTNHAPVLSQVCPITRKPAKYLDPVTRLPFYDNESLTILRERYPRSTVLESTKEVAKDAPVGPIALTSSSDSEQPPKIEKKIMKKSTVLTSLKRGRPRKIPVTVDL